MKTKPFDCVEMMHRGARRIYVATKGLSQEKELAYWRAKAGELLPYGPAPSPAVSAVREERAPYRLTR